MQKMTKDDVRKMYRRHRSALTRVKKTSDPDKIIANVDKAETEWEESGWPFPDTWQDFIVARQQAKNEKRKMAAKEMLSYGLKPEKIQPCTRMDLTMTVVLGGLYAVFGRMESSLPPCTPVDECSTESIKSYRRGLCEMFSGLVQTLSSDVISPEDVNSWLEAGMQKFIEARMADENFKMPLLRLRAMAIQFIEEFDYRCDSFPAHL